MANDYPIEDIAASCLREIETGGTIHQKWTCGHCGVRQTMDEPNKLFRSGRCEECGQVTVISKCNFLLIRPLGRGA